MYLAIELSKYYINQSIRMSKLKTIKLKLYPKNPIWISPDLRILQMIPPVPQSWTLSKPSFWVRVCQGYKGVLVNHTHPFAKSFQSKCYCLHIQVHWCQAEARFSFYQRQMAKSSLSRCQFERGWCVYNGMSYGSLSPKLAAASCRLVLIRIGFSSSAS